MKKAAALVRVSTEIQTLDSQKEALRSIAKSFGFEIPDNFIFEEKITGYDEDFDKDRKSIVELRHFIEIGKPEAIFIWELSRLSRRATKVQNYIFELSVRPKIPMYFHDLEKWTLDIETKKPIDENILKIVGNAEGCETERNKIKLRTKRGRDNVASQGLYVGHLSDGYIALDDKQIVIDEDRIGVIRRIFQMALKGEKTTLIAKTLNEEGIPTISEYRRSNPFWKIKKPGAVVWTKAAIGHVLKNRWYIGERSYNGSIYQIPSIITIEDWNKIQQQLIESKISNTSYSETKHFYMLNGIIKCGICGKNLYGHYTGLNNHYYCSSNEANSCGLRGINQDNIDAIVFDVINKYYISRDFQRSIITNKPGYVTQFLPNNDSFMNLLKEKQKATVSLINGKKDELNKENEKLTKIIANILTLESSNPSYNIYENFQKECEHKISKITEDISEYELLLADLKVREKQLENSKSILETYESLKAEDFKYIIRPLIEKVVVYNADESITVVELVLSQEMMEPNITIIYAPRLLKENYILLNKETVLPTLISPLMSREALAFTKYSRHFADKTILWYDDNDKKIKIFEGVHLLNNSHGMFLVMDLHLDLLKEEFKKQGMKWDFQDFQNEITVRDFILKCRENKKPIFDNGIFSAEFKKNSWERGDKVFIKNLIFSYKRLHALDEKAEQQQAKYREWRKKYNTGKPTQEPYIQKDEVYDNVMKERKKLYHRIEKIKKKKHTSEADREKEISIIREKLKKLKLEITYIGNASQARKMRKEQSKKK